MRFTVILTILLTIFHTFSLSNVYADGPCSDANVQNHSGGLQYNAPAGLVVTKVCVEINGNHEILTFGSTSTSCYVLSGLATSSIDLIINNPGCVSYDHMDIYLEPENVEEAPPVDIQEEPEAPKEHIPVDTSVSSSTIHLAAALMFLTGLAILISSLFARRR